MPAHLSTSVSPLRAERVQARCTGCGRQATLRVYPGVAELLAGEDPSAPVLSYHCHGCHTPFDIAVSALAPPAAPAGP
jgi:hypothetical protein